VALLEKRGFLYNHSGDFPQVILIVPSHVPNNPLNCPERSGDNFFLGQITYFMGHFEGYFEGPRLF
jgi:hypothetical protein